MSSITLAPFDEGKLNTYLKWVNDPEIGALIDHVLPVTRTEHSQWHLRLISDADTVVFSIMSTSHKDITETPVYIGNVWLVGINWRHRNAEVRILIGEKYMWGRGCGTKALDLITRFSFDSLNLHKVYAYVLEENERAVKAFRATGFTPEGVLRDDRFLNGKYKNVMLMAQLRTTEEAEREVKSR